MKEVARHPDGFTLFLYPRHNAWLNLKIVSDRGWGGSQQERRKKRNWHLGWSTQEQRFRGCHDIRILAKHHPGLVEWVQRYIRENEGQPT
jgi:hypothetical protein